MAAFFFFQAEDGIRDGRVTGVQTCALPICTSGAAPLWASFTALQNQLHGGSLGNLNPTFYAIGNRSEERRVGKECRARWSTYDEKKSKNELDILRTPIGKEAQSVAAVGGLRHRIIYFEKADREARSVHGRFFFFSSRRRHTRWTGDWSSDVCSSDLHLRRGATVGLLHRPAEPAPRRLPRQPQPDLLRHRQ